MKPEAFVHGLHFNQDKIQPLNWNVDWEDAPLPYKLYRGLPMVPLSAEVPPTLKEKEVPANLSLSEIGHFLWYSFGLTRFTQFVLPSNEREQEIFVRQIYRRFAPSGGGLYPNELYMYLKIKDLPSGVYHYDVAHHRLVLLREGNFDSYLTRALGNRCDVSNCFGTVFVSTFFWKNFFKYNNFSYRLQGLDAGVLMGHLLEVAKKFSFETGVYFQFLDRSINHLLGLSTAEESVYAVIPMSVNSSMNWFTQENHENRIPTSASDLCKEIPCVHHDHYVRSQRVTEYPMLIKMNEYSLLESVESFRQIEVDRGVHFEGQTFTLPRVKRMSFDLASIICKRYSPGLDFVLGPVSQTQLAKLLRETMASFVYRNDLDGDRKNPETRVSLYCCLHGVEGIPDGSYSYDVVSHSVRQLRVGDYRFNLHRGMDPNTLNLFQVPLCVHVAGAQNYLLTELGYRGYRIQQMEAGMLVQRLLLMACAIGMGGHPLLGFNTTDSDHVYHMIPQKKTTLIQIPIGYYRSRHRLEGSLHC